MPVITYTATCTAKTLLARDVYELRFTKPEGFIFKPGQFVLFAVPLMEDAANIQARAFSIASTPAEQDLLFVFKLIPGGRASRWCKDAIEVGTEVSFTGPFGNFLLDAKTNKEFLFLATGTGIAPFRSMIESALISGDRRRMDLVFSVKNEADLFWHQEFAALAREHPSFAFHITFTAASSSWTGLTGRLQQVTPPLVEADFSQKSLYACGNPDMTKEIKRLALEAWGMAKGDVHVEGYI